MKGTPGRKSTGESLTIYIAESNWGRQSPWDERDDSGSPRMKGQVCERLGTRGRETNHDHEGHVRAPWGVSCVSGATSRRD